MRFRCRLTEEKATLLHSLINSFERIAKNAVFYLSPETVNIALITDAASAPKGFAELRAEHTFSEYRVESQSSNSILVEVSLQPLQKALLSCKSSQCQIKLVKRGDRPCLCVEVHSTAMDSTALNIQHDVPIKLHRASDILHYVPPDVPPPHVALELPRNYKLKAVIEKLGKIAKQATINAYQQHSTKGGRLVFSVQHSAATVRAVFHGLDSSDLGTDVGQRITADSKASVQVDMKKLSAVFAVMAVSHMSCDNASLYIVDATALIMHLTLIGGVGHVSLYMPVVYCGDDENEQQDERFASTWAD